MLDLGVYKRARERDVKVITVRVLTWDLGQWPPVATFVFRGEKLWYASYPTSPSEATPEKLTALYGKEARVSTRRNSCFHR